MPVLEQDDVKTWNRSKVEKEMKERLGDVQSIREAHDGSLANVVGDDADRVREHNLSLSALGERLDEIKEFEGADAHAQKLHERLSEPGGYRPQASGGSNGQPQIDLRDAGTIFSGSPAIEAYRDNRVKDQEAPVPIGALLPEYRSLDVQGYRHPTTRAATLGSDDALVDVGTEFPPESRRVGVLVDQRFQQPNIADLMPQATIDQAAVPFMRETVNSEAAAETAEGALLPEASIAFTEDSAPVRKIGVLLPVTEEILEDEQMLRGHVNGRLPLFIRNREDNQLLNGTGVAPNLQGILTLSGVDATTSYSIGGASAQTKMEAIFTASMRVLENFVTPDAAVLGLGLWEDIRLAKDGNGNYLIAPATDQAVPRVWGLRVVTNQRMPAEAAGNEPILVGGFSESSQIWRRRAITLAVSDSHDDNFGRDILVVKATTRLAVTHYRAGGYATVTSAV